MLIIAHYRKSKIWPQLALGILVLAFLVYLTFWSYDGHLLSRSMNSPRAVFLIPGLIFAWICGFVASTTIIIKIKQLILNDGRAVWISREELFFLRSWYVSVPCREIVSVSSGEIATSTVTKTGAVVLLLKSGRKMSFPTSSLLESRDTIIAHINDALRSKRAL